jgi:hypothetical protein
MFETKNLEINGYDFGALITKPPLRACQLVLRNFFAMDRFVSGHGAV